MKLVNHKLCILGISSVLFFGSCNRDNKSTTDSEMGQLLINEARAAMGNNEFDKAISLIDSVRKAYPLAMNAREDGILLKDSVEMAKAQYEINSLSQQGITSGDQWEEANRRLKYFARKLQHDKEQRKNHSN